MHARGEGNNKIITEVEHFSRFELSFVKIFTRNINRKQMFHKSHSGYEVDGLAILHYQTRLWMIRSMSTVSVKNSH